MNTRAACAALAGARGQNGLRTGTPTGIFTLTLINTLNPDSLKVVRAVVEPSLAAAKPDQKFQFERHGYFVADRADHGVSGKVVFNRVTGLKDSYEKK